MIFHKTTLEDATLIETEPRGDDRGMFARTFCAREFEEAGIGRHFVQQNMSVSRTRGTVRGMHFQKGRHAEAKLVRCVHGAIVDVIIDIRRNSPTFLKHQAFELTADNGRLLFVPEGFAHGFQTLTDDVEVSYLVSAYYASDDESGLRYDDPTFDISWPLPVTEISQRDAAWMDFAGTDDHRIQ